MRFPFSSIIIPVADAMFPGRVGQNQRMVKGKLVNVGKPFVDKFQINVRPDTWNGANLAEIMTNEGSNVQDIRDELTTGEKGSQWDAEYSSLEAQSFAHEKLKPKEPLDFAAGRVYDPAWNKTDLDANRDKGIREILQKSPEKGGYGLPVPKEKKP